MVATVSAVTQVGEVGQDWFSVYLIPETLRVTVLGSKQQGDTVNLEIEAQTQVRCLDLDGCVKISTASPVHVALASSRPNCS